MLLREHPLLSYRGFSSWPPRWRARGDGSSPHVVGEIGVLTEVVLHTPRGRSSELFLFMEHRDHRYLAAMLFNDDAFCRQIYALLRENYGRTIEEIGSLDVDGLL